MIVAPFSSPCTLVCRHHRHLWVQRASRLCAEAPPDPPQGGGVTSVVCARICVTFGVTCPTPFGADSGVKGR